MSQRDSNVRHAIAYLYLVLAVERFYDDEDRAIKDSIKALEGKLQ